MKKRTPLIALSILALSACQMEPVQPVSSAVKQTQGLSFVQANCADCHSVKGEDLSPNPDAPSFALIANRQGLSESSLTEWLISAHNYPAVMEFDLSPDQAEMIAKHMVTLQRDDYRPLE